MSDAWRHTHTVTLRDGAREVYLDDEGRAYTREEWDAEVSADIERRPDGVWTLLGDPRGVLEVHHAR